MTASFTRLFTSRLLCNAAASNSTFSREFRWGQRVRKRIEERERERAKRKGGLERTERERETDCDTSGRPMHCVGLVELSQRAEEVLMVVVFLSNTRLLMGGGTIRNGPFLKLDSLL